MEQRNRRLRGDCRPELLFGLLQRASLHEEAGENGAHMRVSVIESDRVAGRHDGLVDATLSCQRTGEQIVEWHAVRMDLDGGAQLVLGVRQIALAQLEG